MHRRNVLISVALLPAATADASKGVDWGGYLVKAFEQLGSDLSAVKKKASNYTSTTTWRRVSDFDVTAAGAGACALPAAGYATLPAEFLYLMRQVYDSAMGVGFILNQSATKADFANVLAHWTGELALDDKTLAEIYDFAEAVARELAENATQEAIERVVEKLKSRSSPVTSNLNRNHSGRPHEQASHHITSNVLAQKAGTKSAGKIAPKVATKAGAKIGAKYAIKAGTAWIPVLSALVCGGINLWIMDSIVSSAEEYFNALGRFRSRRYNISRSRGQGAVRPMPSSAELMSSEIERAYLVNVKSITETIKIASTGSSTEVESAARAAARSHDMSDYVRSLTRDRRTARPLNDQGKVLFGQLGPDRPSSEYRTLLEIQRKALEHDPLDVEIASNYAIYLFNAGELDKALKLVVYAFSLPRQPDNTGRTADWSTVSAILAVRSDRINAANALFVTLALSSDVKRRCEAAIQATRSAYGRRHRQATEDMLARVRDKQLSDDPGCGVPVSW